MKGLTGGKGGLNPASLLGKNGKGLPTQIPKKGLGNSLGGLLGKH
jgi:hypothetical protein